MLATRLVISSSWVGDNRYFACFRSSNKKSSADQLRMKTIDGLPTSESILASRPLLDHKLWDEMFERSSLEAPTTSAYTT